MAGETIWISFSIGKSEGVTRSPGFALFAPSAILVRKLLRLLRKVNILLLKSGSLYKEGLFRDLIFKRAMPRSTLSSCFSIWGFLGVVLSIGSIVNFSVSASFCSLRWVNLWDWYAVARDPTPVSLSISLFNFCICFTAPSRSLAANFSSMILALVPVSRNGDRDSPVSLFSIGVSLGLVCLRGEGFNFSRSACSFNSINRALKYLAPAIALADSEVSLPTPLESAVSISALGAAPEGVSNE